MAIYCGIDFHPRQQSVCYCDAADGEIRYRELHHERDDLYRVYSQFTGEVIAGLEASGYSACSSSCSPNSVIKSSPGTRPRSAAGPSAGRRTTSLMCPCVGTLDDPHFYHYPRQNGHLYESTRLRS